MVYASEKDKELLCGSAVSFPGEILSRCHSGVPCAAAVVAVRHGKPAGRLPFATAVESNGIMRRVSCKQRHSPLI